MTDNDGKTPAERLEAALADMEAQKAAAAEFRDEHKAEFAAEIARLNAAHAKLATLPQQERRQVLAAAGLKDVSAAPIPITPLRGGSFARTPSQQAPEPVNWKLWLNMPQVALWEAVALLLNIDPRSLKHSPQGWMAGPGTGPHFEPGSFPSPVKLTTFDDAMLLAARAANYAGPIHLRTGLAEGMNKRTALVALPEVVAFFVGCEWEKIPEPLLHLASHPAKPESSEQRQDRRLNECEAAGLTADREQPNPTETAPRRRVRLLDWFEAEVEAAGEHGALERVTARDKLKRPTADRSNIGKDISRARDERAAAIRAGAMFGALGK